MEKHPRSPHEPFSTTTAMPLDILLCICLGLNILIFLLLLKMGSKLNELSGKLNILGRSASKPNSPASSPTIGEPADPDVDSATGSPFEEFLNEDPRRRTLGKKEQFAAYRHWRDEKGLNWNNSSK